MIAISHDMLTDHVAGTLRTRAFNFIQKSYFDHAENHYTPRTGFVTEFDSHSSDYSHVNIFPTNPGLSVMIPNNNNTCIRKSISFFAKFNQQLFGFRY